MIPAIVQKLKSKAGNFKNQNNKKKQIGGKVKSKQKAYGDKQSLSFTKKDKRDKTKSKIKR